MVVFNVWLCYIKSLTMLHAGFFMGAGHRANICKNGIFIHTFKEGMLSRPIISVKNIN